MGPPTSRTSSAYVPPQKESNSTLLGGGVLPASDVRDDLNRTPATTVELRFEPIARSGGLFSHGFIVVTDNKSGSRWRNEGHGEVTMLGTMPGGMLSASTSNSTVEQANSSKLAASFSTDAPADEVAQRLTQYGSAFSAKRIPYTLAFPPPEDLYGLAPSIPMHNSNYYIGSAWEHVTGGLPRLPPGISAPGWGDHRSKSGRPQ